jgi:hypothetical protein
MLTCKSPRKVMRLAHAAASRFLRAYSSKFSRHDYTLPQLFACLAVREQMRLSYRGAEALLRDGRSWCRAVGMRRKTPDHATLHRAAGELLTGRRLSRALDVLAEWFALGRLPGDTLAVDSTCHDTHHRSRHYERRCRRHAAPGRRTADARRGRSARRTPKLSLGVDARSHAILSAAARAGQGSDAPDFAGLLFEAWRRYPGKSLKRVLADAGFDSEANHELARRDVGVRSYIRAGVGRPGANPPSGPLPQADGPHARRPAEGKALRPAGAGRDRHEHDQAQPGRRPARPPAPHPPRRAALQGRRPRPDAPATSRARVETEPSRP